MPLDWRPFNTTVPEPMLNVRFNRHYEPRRKLAIIGTASERRR